MVKVRSLFAIFVMLVFLVVAADIPRVAMGTTIPDDGINITGATNGWVGSGGLRVTIWDGEVFLSAKYKISTSSAENYTGLVNTIDVANNSTILLPAGTGLYVVIQSSGMEYSGVFGPYQVDNVPPEITTTIVSNSVSYTIADVNGVKMDACGYEFNDSETKPSSFSGTINGLSGTLSNTGNKRYLHLKGVDIAGNENWKVVDLGDFSGVKFSANSYSITLTVDNTINLAQSLYTFMGTDGSTISTGYLEKTATSFSFPGTGTYYITLSAVNNNGVVKSITSPTYSGANRDVTKPVVAISESGNGMKLVVSDTSSGVNYSRSYYVSKGVSTSITSATTTIVYRDFFYEMLFVHIEDNAGNLLETYLPSYYLNKTLSIDMYYDAKYAYISVPTGYSPDAEDYFEDYVGGYYSFRLKGKNTTVAFSKDDTDYFDVYFNVEYAELATNDLWISWDLSDQFNPVMQIMNADLYLIDFAGNSQYRIARRRWTAIKKEKTILDLSEFEPGSHKIEISLMTEGGTEYTFEKTLQVGDPLGNAFDLRSTTTGTSFSLLQFPAPTEIAYSMFTATGTAVPSTPTFYASGTLYPTQGTFVFPDTVNEYYVRLSYVIDSRKYVQDSPISRATVAGSGGNSGLANEVDPNASGGTSSGPLTYEENGIRFDQMQTGVRITLSTPLVQYAQRYTYLVYDYDTRSILGNGTWLSSISYVDVANPANTSRFYVVVKGNTSGIYDDSNKDLAGRTATSPVYSTTTLGTAVEAVPGDVTVKSGITFSRAIDSVTITLDASIPAIYYNKFVYTLYNADTNVAILSGVSNTRAVLVPDPSGVSRWYIKVEGNTVGVPTEYIGFINVAVISPIYVNTSSSGDGTSSGGTAKAGDVTDKDGIRFVRSTDNVIVTLSKVMSLDSLAKSLHGESIINSFSYYVYNAGTNSLISSGTFKKLADSSLNDAESYRKIIPDPAGVELWYVVIKGDPSMVIDSYVSFVNVSITSPMYTNTTTNKDKVEDSNDTSASLLSDYPGIIRFSKSDDKVTIRMVAAPDGASTVKYELLNSSDVSVTGKGGVVKFSEGTSVDITGLPSGSHKVRAQVMSTTGSVVVTVTSESFGTDDSGGGGGNYYTPTVPSPTPIPANTVTPGDNPNWMTNDGLSYIPGYNKFISGYDDGTFRASNPITRAEFCTILNNITVGGSPKTSGNYSDVSSGKWYSEYVNRMISLGVAFGSNGVFRPDDYITRGEAAAFLNRLGLNKVLYSAITFSDTSDYAYKQDITEATTKGLISGYSDGTFKPDYMISRVEAVVIINRALGRKVSAESLSNVAGVKFPPDMDTSHWGYYDVVGALNSHTVKEFRNGYEIWDSVK
jgi:hypothetical protein